MKWGNLRSPRKVAHALRIEGRSLGVLLRHGLPDVMPQFLGGLGDELLLSCVARELRRRDPRLRVWQVSSAAELLRGNPDYARVFTREHWPLRHALLLNGRRLRLRYSEMPEEGERETPVAEHILAVLCRGAGVRGEVALRPYCHLEAGELREGLLGPRQVAVQSVGTDSYENVMRNKIWFHERLQRLVDEVRRSRPGTTVVQLGVGDDPRLEGAVDLRGRLSLRQSAAVLARSTCFVGTSGFLVHLARAVDCRSVVIYGGREHAWQTGYPCNENLESHQPCAPCWLWNRCAHDRACMREIDERRVLDALDRAVARYGEPLETAVATIGEGGPGA